MSLSAVTIGGIIAPDSDLARKAAALAAQAHAPVLLNHVHRTYWFAEFLARKREMRFDREVVYIASLLHDLGLSHQHGADKRFEVDGADAAARFLHAHDYPEDRTALVWDAIALHSAADIADRREPEVALVHFGAHVDVMGLRMEEIPVQLIDDTLSLYPRLGFKEAFTSALAEIARTKPHTAIGTGLADIGRRLVPGLDIPNVCDLLLGAPFES
ncbi:HD domain-containing protein [Novosphingobium sp.]|uniref:HD domain-containing protein n=1 Tax=Novosphingobium sp. TaxID=1874826 RepID=UPI0031D1938D